MKKETLVFDTVAEFKAYLRKLKCMPKNANRQVYDANVKAIKLSVIEVGVKRAIVVAYTNVFSEDKSVFDYYIIDGQHLGTAILETADELIKGHFAIFIDELLTFEDIIYVISKLNSVGKARKLIESLQSWVFEGREHYLYFSKVLSENQQYSINSLIECFTGKAYTSNGDFKNGRMVITDEQKRHAKNLIALHKELMNTGLKYTTNSFSALVRFNIDFPEISFETIYKKVKKSTKHLKDIRNRDAFISFLKTNCVKRKR